MTDLLVNTSRLVYPSSVGWRISETDLEYKEDPAQYHLFCQVDREKERERESVLLFEVDLLTRLTDICHLLKKKRN